MPVSFCFSAGPDQGEKRGSIRFGNKRSKKEIYSRDKTACIFRFNRKEKYCREEEHFRKGNCLCKKNHFREGEHRGKENGFRFRSPEKTVEPDGPL